MTISQNAERANSNTNSNTLGVCNFNTAQVGFGDCLDSKPDLTRLAAGREQGYRSYPSDFSS